MIEIVIADLIENEDRQFWSCWLEISQGAERWMLPATAPGDLAEADLQAHFETREAELWDVAQRKQYAVDVFERVGIKRVMKAFALLSMDEFNILRRLHGLPDRTPDQIVAGIKGRLRG